MFYKCFILQFFKVGKIILICIEEKTEVQSNLPKTKQPVSRKARTWPRLDAVSSCIKYRLHTHTLPASLQPICLLSHITSQAPCGLGIRSCHSPATPRQSHPHLLQDSSAWKALFPLLCTWQLVLTFMVSTQRFSPLRTFSCNAPQLS